MVSKSFIAFIALMTIASCLTSSSVNAAAIAPARQLLFLCLVDRRTRTLLTSNPGFAREARPRVFERDSTPTQTEINTAKILESFRECVFDPNDQNCWGSTIDDGDFLDCAYGADARFSTACFLGLQIQFCKPSASAYYSAVCLGNYFHSGS